MSPRWNPLERRNAQKQVAQPQATNHKTHKEKSVGHRSEEPRPLNRAEILLRIFREIVFWHVTLSLCVHSG